MALNKTLKDYIKTIFYTNGNEKITGQTSQDGLVNLIDTLGAPECKGMATPTTNPGTATNGTAQWYFAVTPGYYIHFGFSVLANQICRLYYNHGTNSWVKEVIATVNNDESPGMQTWDIDVAGSTVQIYGTEIDELYNKLKLIAGESIEISASSGTGKDLNVTINNTAPFVRNHKMLTFIESDCLIAEPYTTAPQMRLAVIGTGSYGIGTPTVNHPGVLLFKDGSDFLSGAALTTHNSFLLSPIGGTGTEIMKANFIAKFPISHSNRFAYLGWFNEPGVISPASGAYVKVEYSATYGLLFKVCYHNGGSGDIEGYENINSSPSTWYRVELKILTDSTNDAKINVVLTVYDENNNQVATSGLPNKNPITAPLMFGCYTLDNNAVSHGDCMQLDYISLEGLTKLTR